MFNPTLIRVLSASLLALAAVNIQAQPSPTKKIKGGAPPMVRAHLYFSPNPKGLDLAPCPDPTPQPPLNQYVMVGGGGVFTIPCTAAYTGTDTNMYNRLLQGLYWNLDRYPAGILPRVANGSNGFPSATFFPQHSIGPVPGLAFENDLPASNSAFGANAITCTLQGQTLATSPIAIFFSWASTAHPIGGPTWVSGLTTGVPNYMYYYDQVWQNPFGTEVRFWMTDYSQYTDGDSFIRTGTDSHGLSGAGLYGGPDADGGIDTDLFARLPGGGILVWAGQQKIRGLDLYARNVYHECVHKRLYEYGLSTGVADSDGDGLADNTDSDGDDLPDNIEIQIGTLPGVNNSVPGWNYSGNYQDAEVFCRMCERDLPVPEDDWADDGFNFGRPASPNRCQRVVESIWPNYTKNGLTWIDARSLVP